MRVPSRGFEVKALLMRAVRIFAARNSAANIGTYRRIMGIIMSLRVNRRPTGIILTRTVGRGTENSIFVGVANYYKRTACTVTRGCVSAKPEEEPKGKMREYRDRLKITPTAKEGCGEEGDEDTTDRVENNLMMILTLLS